MLAMGQKRRVTILPLSYQGIQPAGVSPVYCDCADLSRGRIAHNGHERVLVSRELRDQLYAQLKGFFPRVEPVSLLLLHLFQREAVSLPLRPGLRQKRRRYHASADYLDQVITKVQRVLRMDDTLLLRDAAAAAFIFPDVDQEGARAILLRVCDSLSLLQAETMLPPLTRETTIQVGIGSYPAPAASYERLLYQVGRCAHDLTLRPALLTRHTLSVQESVPVDAEFVAYDTKIPGVPFMELPVVVSAQLQRLIPCATARELRCVPVGRDQHRLTVAMADPANSASVHYLQEVTGMVIFPVACKEQDLNKLLTAGW